jgi:hypothetical protein
VGEEGNTSEPLWIETYNKNVGLVDMGDLTANSYIISWKRM